MVSPKTCPHRAASAQHVQTREMWPALRSRATSARQALNCDSLTSWRFGTHSLLSTKDRGEIITRCGGSDVDLNPKMRRCPGADPAAPTVPPADPLPMVPEHRRGRKRSPFQQVSSRRHRRRPRDGAWRRASVCRRGCGPATNAVPGHRRRRAHRTIATPRAPRRSPLGLQGARLRSPRPAHSRGRSMGAERGKPEAERKRVPRHSEAAGSEILARQGEQPCRQA
ncbi:uncharacterized protein AAES06_018548 [Glossophaga mutica]